MSGDDNTPLEDPVLLPPPFGTTETTGEHLLPTAMSMDDLLRNETESGQQDVDPIETSDEGDFVEPSPVVAPVELQDEEPTHPAGFVDGEGDAQYVEATGGNRMLWIGAVIFLIGGGLAWAFLRGDSSVSTAQTDAESAPATETVAPEPKAESPAPKAAPAPAQAGEVPTELAALRALTFEERHALLAKADGDVPVDLHIGLDLVQAGQSEHPCRTFADALSTIESAKDPAPFDWALEEARAPSGDDPGCDGLASRLDALKNAADAEEVASADASRPSRTAKRKKTPQPSRGRPAPPPPEPAPAEAESPPPQPEPQPEPQPKKNSIATKLDDGELRGLGD